MTDESVVGTSKNKSVIISIFLIATIILIVLAFPITNALTKGPIIKSVKQVATKEGLEDVDVKILGRYNEDSDWYNVDIYASNLNSFSYEDFLSIQRRIEFSGAHVFVRYFKSGNDTYKVLVDSVYKNGKCVYTNENQSLTYEYENINTCEVCTKEGIYCITGIFSGEEEYYCKKHYEEMQNLLSSLN